MTLDNFADGRISVVFCLFCMQRAMLSPVAGPFNISGVHSVQSLLDKFRLPLIVRLVCGVIPIKVYRTVCCCLVQDTGVAIGDTESTFPLRSLLIYSN